MFGLSQINLTSRKKIKGFTMMEMVLVIIILGIMSVGISGFISLSTQTYINATSRDELIGNARFVIERLSRELRNVVPNSIRVDSFGPLNCIQFTPIVASTVYKDIPVLPEPARKTLSVIPFKNIDGSNYQCDNASGCTDLVTIYPLTSDDIFENHTDETGKTFIIDSVNTVTTSNSPWEINILNSNDIHFSEDSPTQRLYITADQVSYCTAPSSVGGFIIRYVDEITIGNQTPPGSKPYLMAGYLNNDFGGKQPFDYQPATLKRNAVVQIHLPFTKDGENYVLDHEVHIKNVP